MSEGYPLQHRLSPNNEGANTLALPTCMLPTDTSVLGEFLSANDHYSTHVNQFGLHTPDGCCTYAVSMFLHTPDAHEYIGFGMPLPTTNINLPNIHARLF